MVCHWWLTIHASCLVSAANTWWCSDGCIFIHSYCSGSCLSPPDSELTLQLSRDTGWSLASRSWFTFHVFMLFLSKITKIGSDIRKQQWHAMVFGIRGLVVICEVHTQVARPCCDLEAGWPRKVLETFCCCNYSVQRWTLRSGPAPFCIRTRAGTSELVLSPGQTA